MNDTHLHITTAGYFHLHYFDHTQHKVLKTIGSKAFSLIMFYKFIVTVN